MVVRRNVWKYIFFDKLFILPSVMSFRSDKVIRFVLSLSILSFNREVPRVLTIYDIDLPLDEARSTIRKSFDKYKDVKDQRVIDMLIEVGYMDLEETLLQHKQRSHLIRNFSGMVEVKGAARKRVMAGSTIDEQFARGY